MTWRGIKLLAADEAIVYFDMVRKNKFPLAVFAL